MVDKITIVIEHICISMTVCCVHVLESAAYVVVEKRALLAITDFVVFELVEHAYLIPIRSTRMDMSLSCPDNMHISPIMY